MYSSNSTSRYTVRSRFARTGLTCAPDVAERVHRLAAPYLDLEPGHDLDLGPGRAEPHAWQVISGAAPPDQAVREKVTALGEVGVEYAVDHSSKKLFHLAPQGETWITQCLLRATRAIHRSAASRQGALFLHSGLVELDGVGVALVGGSRAGKTSLIMASVLNGSGVMVCNDDVSLVTRPDEHGVTGIGWPRSISVRLDTLDVLFGRDRAETVRSSLSHPANETILSLRDSGVEQHGTALIYPWEYADLLGTGIGRSVQVEAVVHLGLTDDPADAGVAPVPPHARGELLAKGVMKLPNKHLNIFGHEPVNGNLEHTRAALTELPTFRFRYEFRDVRRQADRLTEYLSRQLTQA